jgi:hypothetical protein
MENASDYYGAECTAVDPRILTFPDEIGSLDAPAPTALAIGDIMSGILSSLKERKVEVFQHRIGGSSDESTTPTIALVGFGASFEHVTAVSDELRVHVNSALQALGSSVRLP